MASNNQATTTIPYIVVVVTCSCCAMSLLAPSCKSSVSKRNDQPTNSTTPVKSYTKSHLNSDDYRNILFANVQEDDFIYLDPPYKPINITANFTGYTNSGFSDKDQEELASTFAKLDVRRCKLLLSNSDTSLVRDLYKDFSKTTHLTSVLRSINSKTTGRAGHTIVDMQLFCVTCLAYF
jgi:site-specific DNA-adenine methylase